MTTTPETGPGVTRWRKKPVVMEAHQWFKNGDHPQDNCRMITPDPASLTQFAPFMSEGEVVRYFRHPDIPGDQACSKCGRLMHDHGWIDTLEDGHNVCPGDWIVTGIQGEHWPVKPDVFAATYEPADSADPVSAERERITGLFNDWIEILMSEPNAHSPSAWRDGFADLIRIGLEDRP